MQLLEHTGLGVVLPGEGLGAVRLGMRREEVRAYLGEPVRAIERDEDGNAVFEYPGRAYFYFDHEEDWRLTHILLEEGAALALSGVAGVSEQAALAWLGDADHLTEETHYFLEEGGRTLLERRHNVKTLGLDLYVDETSLLTGCAIRVLFDDQDRVLWADGH
jgi:hypothetical protein